ncbi:Adenylate and Guanylate cyclase catalytic domain containing protein [Trichomonas vaginalis G3]|uniref:Adenylate and Guanylate cyclase catalytic domain containing protein n=1 Tax=Trichomonas vaginalis (strain ATCC PRA-98 / G3) TaxID=412133 RepID=A2F3J3_TRIV3|nr:guanylate cyclase protein [Trichomonas vaginalis G3]EAY00516.1 Adenylate and Guanylate cyclase catalytic domain containing protein [Trichomonas vaginalis G3]KAI5550193.1 guanylate cyclase protein [Trichomonas vaginalis G3]|eukprot:XP_001313445.1 Adenylate and Guanylate cyclase catalytic domain containing protein [Trichomonas vaginalis G3]
MAESSVSKSVSASSQSRENYSKVIQGKGSLLDKVFPLFEQMIQHVKMPAWIMGIIMFYLLCQVLSICFWVYTPVFQKTSGPWTKVNNVLMQIFTFINPLDYTMSIQTWVIVDILIAVFCILWIIFTLFLNHLFYTISVPTLYISFILTDMLTPILIVPSAYICAHGITDLKENSGTQLILEIVLGFVAFSVYVAIFLLSSILKARSVVLASFLFPMFEYDAVTIWIIITATCSILSAVFNYFDSWFYTMGGILHIIITFYVQLRVYYLPFYDLWRNVLMMDFCITTVILNVNYFVVAYSPNLTFNYTIFVFIIALILNYIGGKIAITIVSGNFRKALTYNPEVSNITEYFDSLKINRNSHQANMWIIVGLIFNCDYFVDGSLTDYCLNSSNLEGAISMLLQVVTLFPFESRKMDVLFKRVAQRHKLGFSDRFLIYQCFRIKMKRLVSDTKDTLEMFNKLKNKNDLCKNTIKSFWDKNEADSNFFSSLSLLVNDVDSLFKASLMSNPNNLRLVTEYSNFLAECKGDFDNAIKESIRAELIGDGKNFNVDVSFRSLVNKFPRYLKDKILDVKDHRILKTLGDKTDASQKSSNSSGNSSTGASFDSNSVDFERQEIVSKKILRDAKVRLAFHHGINDTKPWEYTGILCHVIASTVIIFVCFVGFYAYVRVNLKWRRSSYKDLSDIGYSTFYTIYANVYTMSKFAADNKRMDPSGKALGDISIDSKVVEFLIPNELSTPMKSYVCMNRSRDYLGSLLNSLADHAANGDNPYKIASPLLETKTTFYVCVNATPDFIIPSSLKSSMITFSYLENYIAGLYNFNQMPSNLYSSNDYCQILSNIPAITDLADTTFTQILEYNKDKSAKYNTIFMIWLIFGLVSMFIIVFFPVVLIDIHYNIRVSKICIILHQLQAQVKDEARKPLILNTDVLNENNAGTSEVKSTFLMVVRLTYYVAAIALLVSYSLFIMENKNMNSTLNKILTWFYLSCKRIILASQCGNNSLQMIFLNGSLQQRIVNVSALRDREIDMLSRFLNSDKTLLYGDSTIPGCIVFDEELDHLHLENYCDLGRSPQSIHDTYACTGLESQIQMLKYFIDEVIKNIESYNGNMMSEKAANYAHILRFHFYPGVIKATKRISDMMEINYDNTMTKNAIFLASACICWIIIFLMPWYFRNVMLDSYHMFLMLLKHLPMQTIIDTPEIIEFFTGKKKVKSSENMSTSKSIVYDTSECIIITNASSVVEIINNSVTANLGLTPDQMLGQQIANFVGTDDQQRINQQLEMMTSGQGSSFWEDHLTLVNDKNDIVPFSVTLIGMKDEGSNEIKSFVFILRNETEEIQKRKAAEEAKAKSEKLLYQILPKDIVVRLNRGETDISFTIPSATIFFIDIVKFSNYTATLTPSEIMANLSLVFATFDKIVGEYPIITKIKLIGDVYMAAAGLFCTEEDDPKKYAEDSVRACLRCQKAMEEINVKLSASLEVRIGVNSGGPLIGGVLGSDKPTFDIIGDPINVAARLQSTDIPGCVQISGDTKTLIEGLDFVIEERGEIYLKGKGNRLTYFVSLPAKSDQEASFVMAISSSREQLNVK